MAKTINGERFSVIIEGSQPDTGPLEILSVRCDYEVESEGVSENRSIDVTTARANSANAIANNCFNDAKQKENG